MNFLLYLQHVALLTQKPMLMLNMREYTPAKKRSTHMCRYYL